MGRLITLVNVDIGETRNNLTDIRDQDGVVIARFSDGPSFQNRANVDVTGVFYHSNTWGDMIIINGNGDVVTSAYITDQDKLNRAYEMLNIPEEILLIMM